MTKLGVTALARNLTPVFHHRHSFSDFAEMVHNAAAGSCEKGGNDTSSRWFIPTEFADIVQLDASGT